MKKIIAVLTVAIMLCTVMPYSAFAVQNPDVDAALNVDGGKLSFDVNDWDVCKEEETGRICAVSQNHGDGTTGKIKLFANAKAGDLILFEVKTDSEEGYDELLFSVDGEEQRAYTGETEWQKGYYVFEEEGEHFITWEYIKDGTDSVGQDCAWLDEIYLGENTFALEGFEHDESMTLIPGSTAEIQLCPIPEYANYGEINYKSADTNIATVDESGTVTGVAIGETAITVSSGEISVQIKVFVEKPLEATTFLVVDATEENEPGIYSIELNTGTLTELVSADAYVEGEDTIYAGEYFDGSFYAYTSDGEFLTIDGETFELVKKISVNGSMTVLDMTYDYETRGMYAIAEDSAGNMYLAETETETGELVIINKLNHAFLGIAAYEGELYAIEADSGIVYSISISVGGNITENVVCETNTAPSFIQTINFDNETGELYWLAMTMDGDDEMPESFIGRIDLEEGLQTMYRYENLIEFSTLYFDFEDNAPLVPVTGVSLDKTELNLTWKETAQLIASIQPGDASNTHVRWSSSDESIVKVQNGIVTAIGNGTATVTVRTVDGGYIATCTVNVTGAPKILLKEDFEDELEGWTLLDMDKDGYTWTNSSPSGYIFEPHNGNGCIASASFLNETSQVLTPDNWLISPAFTATTHTELSWYVAALDPEYAGDHYAVYVIPEDYNEADLAAFTPVYEGEPAGEWTEQKVNLDKYAGQKVRIAFRHYNVTDMFWLMLDDICVYDFTNGTENKLGDVNLDGKLNTADAVEVLRYAAGMTTLSDAQMAVADVNADSKVNTADAVRLLQYSAGMCDIG